MDVLDVLVVSSPLLDKAVILALLDVSLVSSSVSGDGLGVVLDKAIALALLLVMGEGGISDKVTDDGATSVTNIANCLDGSDLFVWRKTEEGIIPVVLDAKLLVEVAA